MATSKGVWRLQQEASAHSHPPWLTCKPTESLESNQTHEFLSAFTSADFPGSLQLLVPAYRKTSLPGTSGSWWQLFGTRWRANWGRQPFKFIHLLEEKTLCWGTRDPCTGARGEPWNVTCWAKLDRCVAFEGVAGNRNSSLEMTLPFFQKQKCSYVCVKS